MSNSLLSNGAISILSKAIQLIVSVGSGFLVARTLGTDGKGELYLLTQFSSVIQVVFLFGLCYSLLYYIKTSIINVRQAISFSLIFNSLIALFLYLWLYGFPNSLSVILGENVNRNFLIVVVLTAQLNIFSSFIGFIMMHEDVGVKRWSLVNLASNFLYLIVLFLLVYLKPFGVFGALCALLISVVVKTIVVCFPAFKGYAFQLLPLKQVYKIFLFGFAAFISNLFLTGVFRIDVFFLNKYVALSEIGIYSVSVNVSELLLLIPNALGVVLFPHLSGLGTEAQLKTMSLVGRLSFILGFVGVCLLLIFSYPFILIVFGERFIGGFVPMLYLLPGLMAMTLNYSYANFFSSAGHPYVVAGCFGLGLIVNVILNLVFIPSFGIYAAAVNSSITYVIITLSFVLVIKRKYKLNIREYVLPSKADLDYIMKKYSAFIAKFRPSKSES